LYLSNLFCCGLACSTFWMTAASGQLMWLNFTGTPAKVLRLWLPYADPAAELVLALNMLQVPNRYASLAARHVSFAALSLRTARRAT
jgi:hypothetical protein